MSLYKKWQYQVRAKEQVKVLKETGYDAWYAENKEDARKIVVHMVPEGASVAMGGSETLQAMGLLEFFRNGKYRFFDRFKEMPFEERFELYRQGMLADFFITSTNAVTKRGELVNVDSSGNRIAAMLFGPKRVIIVCGANKIVQDIDAGFRRIREIAPMNAKRNGHAVACAETGWCIGENCQNERAICNGAAIIYHGKKVPGRISIIMVAEELGF